MTAIDHEATVASRFDLLSDRFKPTVDQADFRLAAIINAIGPLKDQRVLDLGCGQGRFAGKLAEAGAKVVGVDRSQGMLTRAPQDLIKIQASASCLPFAGGSFDVIIAIEVLEHIKPITPILAEARRCLRPGGLFLVIDKNAASLNAQRPWLPGLAVKWLDERRGLWMYPPESPVRERWFWPALIMSDLRMHFDDVKASYLEAPEEVSKVFRMIPVARRFVLWSGRVPGEAA